MNTYRPPMRVSSVGGAAFLTIVDIGFISLYCCLLMFTSPDGALRRAGHAERRR